MLSSIELFGRGGMIEGFEVGNNEVMITHLQFANDTLIMFKNSV